MIQCYHEAMICNLLEVAMFHEHVVESASGCMMELVDYCMRKVTWLITLTPDELAELHPPSVDRIKEKMNTSSRDVLERQWLHIGFKTGVLSISLLRYLAEHIQVLPLSTVTRMLDTHDVLISIVPLMDSPPWTTRSENGEWKKFVDQKWKTVPAQELLQVTKLEAQLWLLLYYLTCSRICRERYSFNTFRKGQVLRLRKYLNEIILDQVPVLTHVQRYMDELSIMNTPDTGSRGGGGMGNSCLVLEAVPVIREGIIKKRDWKQLAEDQMKEIYSKIDKKGGDLAIKRIVDVYSMDGVEDVLGEPELPAELMGIEENTTIEEEVQMQCNTPQSLMLEFYKEEGDAKPCATTCFEIDIESKKEIPLPNEQLQHRYTVLNTPTSKEHSSIPFNAIMKATIVLQDQTRLHVFSQRLALPILSVSDMVSDLEVIQVIEKEDKQEELLPKKIWKQAGGLVAAQDKQPVVVQVQFVKMEQVTMSDIVEKSRQPKLLVTECNSIEEVKFNCYHMGLVFVSLTF